MPKTPSILALLGCATALAFVADFYDGQHAVFAADAAALLALVLLFSSAAADAVLLSCVMLCMAYTAVAPPPGDSTFQRRTNPNTMPVTAALILGAFAWAVWPTKFSQAIEQHTTTTTATPDVEGEQQHEPARQVLRPQGNDVGGDDIPQR